MKITIRFLSLFLALIILFSALASCDNTSSSIEIITSKEETEAPLDELISNVVSDIIESLESSETTGAENTTAQGSESQTETTPTDTEEIIDAGNMYVSYNVEDYVGDLETFTYGLMIHQLKYAFTTFPAWVVNEYGETVSGIGYYDSNEIYTDPENEDMAYVMCGFIPHCGELIISEEDFNHGLFLGNVNYPDDDIAFIWKYRSDAIYDHCVVYGQYLKYGVDETGRVFYESCDFSREVCDLSLGALYSYDDSKYLYDPHVGEYTPISGESISITIDYEQLEKGVNEIIANQDQYFSLVDTSVMPYFSYEAVCNVLASMSEETFMGYSTAELIEVAKSLDANQCIEFSPSGLILTDIADPPAESATAATKWLVGSACVITAITAMVTSYILSAYCPFISSAVGGAVAGAAIDIFFQVVIYGQGVSEIDWRSVAISAVSGAISGLLNPTLSSVLGDGFTHAAVDIIADGALGGIESAALAFLDGARGKELIDSFGYGFVVGAVISGGIKGIAAGAKVAANKLIKPAGKLIAEHAPDLIKNPCKFVAEKVSDTVGKPIRAIGDGIEGLRKELEDAKLLNTKIKLESGEYTTLKRLLNDGYSPDDIASFNPPQELKDKANKALAANGWKNLDGNTTSKEAIITASEKVKNGTKLGYLELDYKNKTYKIYVQKDSGILSILPDEKDFPSVSVLLRDSGKNNLGRTANFIAAMDEYKKMWLKDPSTMPDEIVDILKKKYPGETIEDILEKDSTTLQQLIRENGWVFHEHADCKTITLMPRELHDKVRGYKGPSHAGAISVLDFVKATYGEEFYELFRERAAAGATAIYPKTKLPMTIAN